MGKGRTSLNSRILRLEAEFGRFSTAPVQDEFRQLLGLRAGALACPLLPPYFHSSPAPAARLTARLRFVREASFSLPLPSGYSVHLFSVARPLIRDFRRPRPQHGGCWRHVCSLFTGAWRDWLGPKSPTVEFPLKGATLCDQSFPGTTSFNSSAG